MKRKEKDQLALSRKTIRVMGVHRPGKKEASDYYGNSLVILIYFKILFLLCVEDRFLT